MGPRNDSEELFASRGHFFGCFPKTQVACLPFFPWRINDFGWRNSDSFKCWMVTYDSWMTKYDYNYIWLNTKLAWFNNPVRPPDIKNSPAHTIGSTHFRGHNMEEIQASCGARTGKVLNLKRDLPRIARSSWEVVVMTQLIWDDAFGAKSVLISHQFPK